MAAVFAIAVAPHSRAADRPTQLDPENPKRWLNEDEIEWFNDAKGIIQSGPDPEKRLLLAAVNHLDHTIGEVIKALMKPTSATTR